MPALPDVIQRLEHDAGRLYARWSPRAWRLACEGPAVRLWDALPASSDGENTLVDYLVLVREAVGLQYLSVSEPADLDPKTGGVAKSFLALALADALPRLLPAATASQRPLLLAQIWNVGERLQSRAVWLNRYLAARLHELERLDSLEPFLERVLGEGLDEVPPRDFGERLSNHVVDLSRFDRTFLPGAMHLATPSLVCVHDRRREGRHAAVLLRPGARGGPLCLGLTSCLGEDDAPAPVRLDVQRLMNLVTASTLPAPRTALATRGGFLLVTTRLSQRLWVGETTP